MDGVLNEVTNTVHKQELGTPDLQTDCGVTHHVPAEHLRSGAIDSLVTSMNTTKCGRCFEGGGGY